MGSKVVDGQRSIFLIFKGFTKTNMYIKQIEITDFLEKGQNLCLPLNEDVTILAGDNGTGKTKSLLIIYYILSYSESSKLKEDIENLFIKLSVHYDGAEKDFIRSAKRDNPNDNLPPYSETLTANIGLIYSGSCESNLINSLLMREYEQGVLSRFMEIVSLFFSGQDIVFSRDTNGYLDFKKGDKYIGLYDLSDGQRRFLLIMVKVLSMPYDRRSLLLIDTPETFLQITCQTYLIDSILKINPNIQLLIVSHSPYICEDYTDKMVSMNGILSKA